MIFVQRKLKIESEVECRYQLLAEKKPLKDGDLIVLLWCTVVKKLLLTNIARVSFCITLYLQRENLKLDQ